MTEIFPQADASPLDEGEQPIRTYVQSVNRENVIHSEIVVDRTHELPGLDAEQHLRLWCLAQANSKTSFRIKDNDPARDVIELAEDFLRYIRDATIPAAKVVDTASV